MTQENEIGYCLDIVRKDDRERYECSLFAPRHLQPTLWTLYAFNQEIAKTRESVSEAMLGEIRLQWWRDVVEELKAGEVREHPVVKAMASVLNVADVHEQLSKLIDAREQDLFDEGPADMAALIAYSEGVGGLLSETALIFSLPDALDDDLRRRARATGSLWAMLGLVRAIPFHWASNRNYVPGDKGRASLATTDAEKMFELAGPSIVEMIDFCKAKVEELKTSKSRVPSRCRHVFLPAAPASLYLQALEKVENNPFKMQEPTAFARLKRLWRASLFREFG